MREADASDVCESIHVITSPAAPLQPELNAGNRHNLSGVLVSTPIALRMSRRVCLLTREVRTRSASRARFANIFVLFESSSQTLS
eukprot:620736-Pyramimonas_sp.AAC.1